MRIGIPKEIKVGETRIAVSPAGVRQLTRRGHEVFVQQGAGVAAGWSDRAYRRAGAKLVRGLATVYRRAELVCKVKEPEAQELRLLGRGQILFTFLHLGGNPGLAKGLRRKGVVAIAYDTIRDRKGGLPLLTPMSEIAGEVAVRIGVSRWRRRHPFSPLTVGVIGCGHVGRAAIQAAMRSQGKVLAFDRDRAKLRRLQRHFGKRLTTFPATKMNLKQVVRAADLLIGAVLIPGKKAPTVVATPLVRTMKPGSVIVDVAIDQGGCIATSRPTTIRRPAFQRYSVWHCAIPNLPALVPVQSSRRLASAVFPYLRRLADGG